MKSTVNRPAHISPDQWQRAQKDLATYRRLLPKMLEEGHAGRIAIIKDDQLVGVVDSVTEALEEADKRFGGQAVATFKINALDVERFAQLDAVPQTNKEATCRS